MNRKKRRPFTPEQIVAAVRRHLVEKVKVSDICDELKIHPNQYYEWQKSFFENGDAAFKKDKAKEQLKAEHHIQELKETIIHKDSVIAEIISENIALKKSNGER
jgi:transposase